MQAGREIKLRRGAFWACTLPMGLGIVGAILLTKLLLRYDGQLSFFVVFAAPVFYLANLLFLPSVTAWLTGLRLRRIDKAERLEQWQTIFLSALVVATCVQVVTGLGYAIYVSIQYDNIFGEISERFASTGTKNVVTRDDLPNAYKTMAIGSVVMWFALTAPLCAAGASIFCRVTKFPTDRTVF